MTVAASIRSSLSLNLAPLELLERTAQKRAVTLKAVKAGAKLIQAAAKARAPKRQGSGALRQSLGTKSVKGKKGKTLAFAVIGARTKVEKQVKPPRGTKLITAKPSKYAHLVEKGTRPHGTHPGARARPFLEPAFNATKDQAIAAGMKVMTEEVQRVLQKEAAKLLGKK